MNSALNGPKMDFALHRIWEGHPIPAGLFIDIMTEKCNLINTHLKTTRDFLSISANITNTSASITFHDIYLNDSKLRQVTHSNLPDLEDQLIYLWVEMQDLLRYFHIDDHAAELASTDTFYHELEYNEMLAANFML